MSAATPDPEHGRPGPLRLLLIDDSPDVFITLCAMLSPSRRPGRLRDYKVDHVMRVADGLAAMREGQYDCYLVDHHVGAESGLELVRSVRAAGILAPIVMLTGSHMIDSKAAEAGANDFLIKGGFDVATFERTVRYALGNADSVRRLADLNATLEEQVDERTRQYVETNTRLLEQIAAREQAESALLRTERLQALGRMTGSVAHDFNNILTALFGSLEILRSRLHAQWGESPEPRLARPLENAIEASRLGERMVEGLLAFARQQPVAPTLLDVDAVIRETEQLLRLTLGSGVRLRLALAGDLAPVRVDRDQLERALLNLASNARDAMEGRRGSELAITTGPARRPAGANREHPGWLRIMVADNGPGMSREALDHAFEPFFSTKAPGHGTGLGLAQVYGFALQSGGIATIDSAAGSGRPGDSAAGSGRPGDSAAGNGRPGDSAAGNGRPGGVSVVLTLPAVSPSGDAPKIVSAADIPAG
ncbi:sensor histidine kinase [Lichenicoccus sp.]|uniref:sensor histidine kinase n=1 Tax=Lichenicoccus sp. TaxID=2781899 RepID=UPI003D0F70FD